MKVIHLAAYEGNIGDYFNHSSFHSLLDEVVFGKGRALQTKMKITEVNIRDFYRNNRKRHFDSEFLLEINSHDILVLGGGRFFDVLWDYSNTGTTFDFSDDFIDGITIPVIINGLGYCEPYKIDENDDIQKSIFARFERYIYNISKRNNWFLSVRNDGSIERIAARFGDDFATLFNVVPDNGFYFDKNIPAYIFGRNLKTVGFSIANDALNEDETTDKIVQQINANMAETIKFLISHDIRVVLFPHIPKDLVAIYKIFEYIGEKGFRKNLVIAPFNPSGINAAITYVSYYKSCDVVVAMRFHANVIAIQNIVPTIGFTAGGIVSGERIIALYHDLGLSDYLLCIDNNDTDFTQKLTETIEDLLSNDCKCKKLQKSAVNSIMKKRSEYIISLQNFLEKQSGG